MRTKGGAFFDERDGGDHARCCSTPTAWLRRVAHVSVHDDVGRTMHRGAIGLLTVHPSSHESQRRHPHDTPRRAAPNRTAPHHTTPIPTRPTQPIPHHATPHNTTTQPHCDLQRTAPTPPTTTFATATALNIVLVGIVHEPYSDWLECCGLSERGR